MGRCRVGAAALSGPVSAPSHPLGEGGADGVFEGSQPSGGNFLNIFRDVVW
jgi:hypothetical protein